MLEKVTSVIEISQHLGAASVGHHLDIVGIAPLGTAARATLTFVGDPVKNQKSVLRALESGAVVLYPSGVEVPLPGSGSVIVVDNPRSAFASVVSAFFSPVVEAGVASTAVVHPSAQISDSASVGEFTVIGPGVVIGEGAEIRNHVVLAANVRIGAGSLIKSHAVVGEEGFGVDKDASGNNIRLPHLGSVVIGDNAEVGNFTTVCSGTIAPTTVGDFTKIDDHVHISHNCQIGANTIITACAEISGSVVIGDEVWIGPNASLIQGISIGDGALIGIAAVVTKSVPAREVQFGNPARRIRDKD